MRRPQRGGEREEHDREEPEAEPLPAGQADAIGERDRVRLRRGPSSVLLISSPIVIDSPSAAIRTGNR